MLASSILDINIRGGGVGGVYSTTVGLLLSVSLQELNHLPMTDCSLWTMESVLVLQELCTQTGGGWVVVEIIYMDLARISLLGGWSVTIRPCMYLLG